MFEVCWEDVDELASLEVEVEVDDEPAEVEVDVELDDKPADVDVGVELDIELDVELVVLEDDDGPAKE